MDDTPSDSSDDDTPSEQSDGEEEKAIKISRPNRKLGIILRETIG